MNRFDPWQPTESDFDRLVDGEMSAAESGRLLAALDHVPEGWRRCALSFLESQCWQKEFSDIGDHIQKRGRSGEEAHPRPASFIPGWWTTLLAMAASMLLAFGLGAFWPRGQEKLPLNDVSAGGIDPTQDESGQFADQVVDNNLPSTNEPLDNIRLVVDGDQEYQVPVYQWDEQRARRWMPGPTAMSSTAYRELQRSGFTVRRHYRFLRVKLPDGRRAVVPVEQLEIIRDRDSERSFQ